MAWTTLTLQVTTPLFNGGADADGSAGFGPRQEAGIRVASIRGAMRFWFRALAGVLTGPDLGLLAALERGVFGSAAGQQSSGVGTGPSRLLLRIPRQPPVVAATAQHDFLRNRRDESRWILYLMGQGLADLGHFTIRRPYVAPGEQFQLKVGFRHATGEDDQSRMAIEGLAFASLWLACAYGGLGARTRRGFGGVRITGADGQLPTPWRDGDAILTPDLGHYETLRYLWPDGALGACMRYILALAPTGRTFDPARAWSGQPPTFPVLSKTHTRAATSGGDPFLDWRDTLMHAGEQFRYFRARVPNTRPGANYHPAIETPEWAEVVHGDSDHFAVGALGLPVVYKDGYVVNVNRLRAEGPLRRASPLWLRAVGEADRWRLLSFAFHSEFLPDPDAPGVNLWKRGSVRRPLRVTDDDVRRLSEQWIGVLGGDGSFADGHQRA